MVRIKGTKTKIKIRVPDSLNEEQRFDVAIKILQFIHDRTTKGKDINGDKWDGEAGRYTEAYADKTGKSEKGPVTLALSREMLGKMQYFTSLSKRGELVLGFKNGTKAERKADGNIRGTYGQPKPIPGKARPFLGILQDDVNDIVRDVADDS